MKFSSLACAVLFALIALATVSARAETRMQVAVGSTPVYSGPSSDAQKVGDAASGEILFVARTEGDWAAISPPERLDVWLNKDFIEGNRVVAKSIQLRSGPGIQYDVVGTLARGAAVMPRGEDGEWCKISPPSSATLWVRKNDLSEVRTHTSPIGQVATVAPPAPPPPPTPLAPPPESPAPQAAPEPTPAPEPAPQAAVPQPEPVPTPAPASAPASSAPVKIAPSNPNAPVPQPVPRPAPVPVPVPAPVAPVVAPPPAPAVAESVPAPVVPPAPAPQAPSVAAPPKAAPESTPAKIRAAQPKPAPRATVPAAPTLRPATAIPATPAPQTAAAPAPTTRTPPPARRAPAMPAVGKSVPATAGTVAAQKSKDVGTTVDPALVEELDLADLPNQGKPVQVEGELRNAPFMAASPTRYRLQATDEDGVVEMICHVHGDSAELRDYIGQAISIRGREYWVEDSDMPVVVVGQIVPLAPASEPVMY